MTELSTIQHSSLKYRPAIDGLRALAVLSVFIFHLNHNWLAGGFVGVDIFFVISGYLITSIILKEYKTGSFKLSRFYQRRIARISPAFFMVALATLVGAYFIYSPEDLASVGANLTAAALSIANMKYMTQGNYFVASPDAQPFLHYWSLSVEEQFYIFFPLFLIMMLKYVHKYLILLVSILCIGSFLTSLIITQLNPVWAFYLLPTRAWELLTGCLLALIIDNSKPAMEVRWSKAFSGFSLGIIALSFLRVHEVSHFPSLWALLPVLGAVGVLIPTQGVSEKWLAFGPLVIIGRISYSLYLWHWPIFSLVDYKMYLASELIRLALKVGLSFLAAGLSFWLIESPSRVFLNRRKNILLTYAFMSCGIVICVPLGTFIHNENYISATPNDVNKGGLVFNSESKARSVILMGDSYGSMYGKVMKEICINSGCKFTVISVDGYDPLPFSNNESNQLWLDSLDVVKREKPDYLVLACSWADKLKSNKGRLDVAVKALRPLASHLVILNQPPILPGNANRASIRKGARPPFYEDVKIRRHRIKVNSYLEKFYVGNCVVVDIASHFQTNDGAILFLDAQGRQLYHDEDHLSAYGADSIHSELIKAIGGNTTPK